MERVNCITPFFLTVFLLLFMGCGRQSKSIQNSPPTRNEHAPVRENDSLKEPNALGSANVKAAKMAEDRINGDPLPPSQFPFPNYVGGPHRPQPTHRNYYTMNDHYTNYLLCRFDIDETPYNSSNEQKILKTSLEMTRKFGPKNFPPVQWVAVIIANRAEWKDLNSVNQAQKVGAIFKSSDVFNSSHDLSRMIVAAKMDRHPLKYDPTQPTPGEQERWTIVERHAATNYSNQENQYH